jgi:hypothetical protein
MAMTVADGTIYFAAKDTIDAVPISCGTPQHLGPAQTPGPVVADGPFIYYSEGASTTGRISKVPKSGGPLTVVANTATRAGSLAIDATSIYWSSNLEGTIRKAAKRGPHEVISHAASAPSRRWSPPSFSASCRRVTRNERAAEYRERRVLVPPIL